MRWVFRGFAVGSMAFAVLVFVVWAHSYRSIDFVIVHSHNSPYWNFVNAHDHTPNTAPFQEGESLYVDQGCILVGTAITIPRGWMLFQAKRYFPVWSMLVLAGVLALPLTGMALIRKWKLKLGMCAICGYDLRATPDRCPECGTIHEGHLI
jgi:hypothetical protein